jgi:exonuclease SbcD
VHPRVELLATPVPRALARVSGTLDELLTGERWSAYENHYLQVTLTDRERPREPMERLRTRFPHVLVLGFAPAGAAADGTTSYAARVRGRTDLEVATDFVAHVRGSAGPAETALLAGALEAVRLAEAGR